METEASSATMTSSASTSFRDASVSNDTMLPDASELDASSGDETMHDIDAGRPRPSAPITRYFDGKSQLDGLPETQCLVTVLSAEISPEIATVGIISFTSDIPKLSQAEIHFGLDANYGLVAPVDLLQHDFRTLLLGMTQSSTYHYRIAVSDGTAVCYGADTTIETGPLNSAPLAEASTSSGAAPGFIITSHDGNAVIYNKAGQLVWSYPMWLVFTVQMSWDGQYMLGRDPGPFDLDSGGTFYRVMMDGSQFTTLDAPGGDHHDFTAIPGGIAYLAKSAEGECDRVYEASLELTDGVPVFDTWSVYQYFRDEGSVEGTEICHANRLHYLLDKDMYTISDRNKDALAIFTRAGGAVTSIGKAPIGNWTHHIQAQGAGLGGEWHAQHGHHWYADDSLVIFANESQGGAAVLHYTIDGSRATLDWKYAGAGASPIQGDVQRLPNGNYLVTANLSKTIVELGADGSTEIGRYVLDAPTGPAYGFGYSRHRASLYGAPAPR